MSGMGVYDYHHDSGRSDRPGVPLAENVQETQEISPNKAYVEVIADFSSDGRMKPLHIVWEDGRSYDIDRILRVDRRASLKAGSQTDMFNEEDPRNPVIWFRFRKDLVCQMF